ncbi:arylamine N-acetyltransferase [Enterobacter sp. Bisph1]|uniref:arylamine N-acetyltransferase n=1 Tax=Enterobacter sp. Bisph1 TaxID=1274399 RepID=UPI00057C316E|nr:arylamine N-acetyltransferase [Enterobacter sp. Bisph1]
MTPFLTAYLQRIGWTQTPDVSLETLRGLHLHHNGAIPFENIDVILPHEIDLSDEGIFQKLVVARRGGYCFEQNGLFERVLKEVGFTVRSLLGRVIIADPPDMPPRTHRILLIQLAGEPWIADVGFGGQSLTAPIRLQEGIEQATPHGLYRLQRNGDDWILQFRHHERWQSMYQFEMGQQYQADFVMGNFHTAHWPTSHFRHHLLMSRHLPDGVKQTLTNFHFTQWQHGQVQESQTFADVAALYEALQTRFGLGVSDARHGFSLQQLEAVMAGFAQHDEKA